MWRKIKWKDYDGKIYYSWLWYPYKSKLKQQP